MHFLHPPLFPLETKNILRLVVSKPRRWITHYYFFIVDYEGEIVGSLGLF